MFIPSSEARKRLTSNSNRLSRPLDSPDPRLPNGDREETFRDDQASPAPTSPGLEEDSEEEIVQDIEPPDNLPSGPQASTLDNPLTSNATLSEMREQLRLHQQEVIDFSKLDALIDGSYEDRYEDRSGRGHGARRYRMRTDDQQAIGEVAALTSQQTAANLFGISQSQVHAYDNAASSSNHAARGEHKADLKARLDSFKEILAAKAAVRLHETLDLLDGEKLAKVKKATNLSRVGKDLATIMRNVEERLDRSGPDTVHFHVWKPEMRAADSYEVVESPIIKARDGGEDLPKI